MFCKTSRSYYRKQFCVTVSIQFKKLCSLILLRHTVDSSLILSVFRSFSECHIANLHSLDVCPTPRNGSPFGDTTTI